MKALYNALSFQLGWFACVLGGSVIGVPVALLLLAVHLRWLGGPGEWRLLLAMLLLGALLDSSLMHLGVFDFAQAGWLCPLWLMALWPLFATTLLHALSWASGRYWLLGLLGAVGGPLSYYAGTKLGALSFGVELELALVVLAVVWGLVTPLAEWAGRYLQRATTE